LLQQGPLSQLCLPYAHAAEEGGSEKDGVKEGGRRWRKEKDGAREE